ncbi:response regulator [Campylobacter sp. FMV-PI01]|uniref:Response regulator n=1 Tax=Campylobacter portucalensis TaxID=2608384 RepID=A0A6L5WIU5_9BACT|nr:response regulator [Campylobacter portucalensis]MSN96392.1 response regulator [Campylobacter portucalensis]
MKILIIENEVYLAQSIATKLASLGHDCEILTNIGDVLKCENKDAILLSTGIFGENIYEVIKKFQNSIIILLISYISNDTVSKPIKAGANDYIQKPFMVEELIRKIHHFEEFKNIKKFNEFYVKYLNSKFDNVILPKISLKDVKFPLFINSQDQIYADKIVFLLSQELKKPFEFLSFKDKNTKSIIKNSTIPLYIADFSGLNTAEKDEIFNIIDKKEIIISNTNANNKIPFETITIEDKPNKIYSGDILSIDDYYKSIIISYEKLYSDTELALRLGISRKSLWEKRKKYGINKTK